MDRQELTVNPILVDRYGHVNYKHIPVLLEPAQDAFMERRGCGFDEIERRWGLRSFVKKLEITWDHELPVGVAVSVDTDVVLGNTSMKFLQNVIIPEYDGKAVGLEMVVVFVDKEGKPTQIPDDLRAMLSRE